MKEETGSDGKLENKRQRKKLAERKRREEITEAYSELRNTLVQIFGENKLENEEKTSSPALNGELSSTNNNNLLRTALNEVYRLEAEIHCLQGPAKAMKFSTRFID